MNFIFRSVLVIFFIPFILVFSHCNLDDLSSEGIQIRGLAFTGGGEKLPDAFPSFANYGGSKNIITGIYKGEKALETPQGAAYLKTEDPIETVEAYYYKTFRENGWSIIQSHKKDHEILIMAESPFNKLITVVLRGDKKTDIKVYVKRLGGD